LLLRLGLGSIDSMKYIFIHAVAAVIFLYLATAVFGIVHLKEGANIIFLAAVWAVLNGIIKPVLNLITLPVRFITLGLASILLNIVVIFLFAHFTGVFVDLTFLKAFVLAALNALVLGSLNILL